MFAKGIARGKFVKTKGGNEYIVNMGQLVTDHQRGFAGALSPSKTLLNLNQLHYDNVPRGI